MEDYRLKQLIEEQLKYDKAKSRKNDYLEDVELARNLQQEFNHEMEPQHSAADAELAKILQQEYNHEMEIEKPSNLVYDTKKKKHDHTKSLVDPSWELVDPTPNIHNLFIAFNQQFFWNKLLAVCVSWSKRMTSCAGICSYQGRGGLCSITLSEPLLKLRPRKDLVQTLLHEMIHAYLFVTHNNKDRDGHGPEFHKHMHRINGEAGTNITVYHSFHDEVRVYQQHWWKCNGPCQHRKPFYGMVRRAMNRAPGPHDRWWVEHQQTCGGSFIKVKEPEKATKKNEKENSKPKNTSKSRAKSPTKSNTSPDIRKFFPTVSSNQGKRYDNTKISNINGFTSGESGSLVLRNETASGNTKPVISLFQGNGKRLTSEDSTSQTVINDYSAVRNHWLEKFDKPNTNTKRPKIDSLASSSKNTVAILVECDICNEMMPNYLLSVHKENCLQNVSVSLNSSASKECPLCNLFLSEALYDLHVARCASKQYDAALENVEQSDDEKVNCLVCKRLVGKSILNKHLDECMSDNIFIDEAVIEEFSGDDPFSDSDVQIITKSPETIVVSDDDSDNNDHAGQAETFISCPVCRVKMAESRINAHLDNCLS